MTRVAGEVARRFNGTVSKLAGYMESQDSVALHLTTR
jgi:hypothetical protein